MVKKSLPPEPPADPEDRIRELRQRVEELAGGSLSFGESEDLPPELRQQFWEQVVAYEEAEWVTPFDLLVRSGVELPAPETLDDAALSAKLWEVFRSLAMLRMFFTSTDHLSDRELYEELWHEDLREEGPDFPRDNDSAWHFDLVGSGSEEDTELYLRYYADEDTRRDWAARWPDDPMPAAETPPHDRDRHLPRAEQPEWRMPDLAS